MSQSTDDIMAQGVSVRKAVITVTSQEGETEDFQLEVVFDGNNGADPEVLAHQVTIRILELLSQENMVNTIDGAQIQ